MEENGLFVRILSEEGDIDIRALIDRVSESSIEVVSELCDEPDLNKSTKDILFEDLVVSQMNRIEG